MMLIETEAKVQGEKGKRITDRKKLFRFQREKERSSVKGEKTSWVLESRGLAA